MDSPHRRAANSRVPPLHLPQGACTRLWSRQNDHSVDGRTSARILGPLPSDVPASSSRNICANAVAQDKSDENGKPNHDEQGL